MAATDVDVGLDQRSYTIHISSGVDFASAFGMLKKRVLVVSDANVAPRYADGVVKGLEQAGADVSLTVVPDGERSKCFSTLESLCRVCAQTGLDRRSAVVALGGGVVGDLAGFLASCYLRGIELFQIPTTLLAMVDSSVGGKTGINIEEGKNLVGAFYQPAKVVIDLAFLDTLPEREYCSGIAEIVKYGAIWDTALFEHLERNTAALRQRDSVLLADIVRRCCTIKAEVVMADEKEGGLRAILNFGHTLGHAIENVSGYGTLLHGEAVAMGMCFAARLSREVCGLNVQAVDRIEELLVRVGLPVDWRGFDLSRLCKVLQTDKKAVGGAVRWVLLREIGQAVYNVDVPESVFQRLFQQS